MSPPLGALRKPAVIQEQHNAQIVRTSPKNYEVRRNDPQHRIGLSDSHDYGYKRVVRENDAHRKASLRPERQAALAKSIAQGYAKHLGLGVPVDLKATARPPQKQPTHRPAPQTPQRPDHRPPPSIKPAAPKPMAHAKPETTVAAADNRSKPLKHTPSKIEPKGKQPLSASDRAALAKMGAIDFGKGGSSVGTVHTTSGPIHFKADADHGTGPGGLKGVGEAGGPVAAGKRSWSIDDLAKAAASAPMSSTPAPKVAVPKTGNEFRAGGTEVVPGEEHLYSADFRKSGDQSESHELKFQQFVPAGTRGGGRDVKFSLVLSKDQLATKGSRDSLRDRMASVVDTSLVKENMKPEEREAVVMALKMRLDEKLAEMARA